MGVPSPRRSIWAHWTTNPEVRRHILHLTRDGCDVFKESSAHFITLGVIHCPINRSVDKSHPNSQKTGPASCTNDLDPCPRKKLVGLPRLALCPMMLMRQSPKWKCLVRWPRFISLNGPAKLDSYSSPLCSQPRWLSWLKPSSIHQDSTQGSCDNIGDDFCLVQPRQFPEEWRFIMRALVGTSLRLNRFA